MQINFEDIPDDQSVMTTWHDGVPLSEVFHFAKHFARHPSIELENILIIHIGKNDRHKEFEDAYRDA